MTTAGKNILIIGGGFSGMAAAIQLRKSGFEVDLVEVDSNWRSYGAGICLGGATLRAFKTLGILPAFLARGHGSDGLSFCLPTGEELQRVPTPRIAGPDVPGGGGIMRPVLAAILADATRASGARVRLGCSFATLSTDAEGAEVSFTDGTRGRYDLVIGADGLYSKTRESLFPDAPRPRYTGQAVWRAVLARPPEIDIPTMWLGVPKLKAGVNPVSKTQMYLFITEDRPVNARVEPTQFASLLRELIARYPAPQMKRIHDQIDEASQIVFRPLESLLVPRPWFKSRVVLIGDAVHATTPHLASGACIGIEDAIVLAEELAKDGDLGDALPRFEARRWERCRMVVENSARLGEIESAGGSKEEQARITRESLMTLAQPI